MGAAAYTPEIIADRLAITDLVNLYFELVDSKQWDRMDEVFADDASATEPPNKVMKGRTVIVDTMRSFEESDEIVLFDQVALFTPRIDGDTAEADIRVRSSHSGVGARQGQYYESLAVQHTRFVRTPAGWRFSFYDWKMIVRLGNFVELYTPELKRMGRL